MRIGSICSGYGGLDTAVAEIFGAEVAWFFEYDKAPSKILAHHWPEIPNYGDITTADWAELEPVDILCAGYPCQPFSIAGNRKGSDDARHLWPYILDGIRQLRPRYVVLENVRGHLSLGFGRVLGDLAEAGYDARWTCVPASDVGAPHRRERIFVIAADTSGDESERWGVDRNVGSPAYSDEGKSSEWERVRHTPSDSGAQTVADPDNSRWREHGGGITVQPEQPSVEHSGADTWGDYRPAIEQWGAVLGRTAPPPTLPDGKNGNHRLNSAFVEWMMGLPEGHVTDSAINITRNEQLKALGNGVVPQQAMYALRILLETP